MESNTFIQKNPLDYIKILFRRKWLIIFPAVLGIVGGIIAVNTLPKIYEASTLMLVEEGRTTNPLISGLAVSTSTAQRLNVLREQLLGWDRLNQLIKTLDLAKGVKSQLQFEDLIKRLRSNIKVKMRTNNIILISYEGADPKEAQSIVKTITDIFIAENLRQQNKEGEDAVNFINDQLSLYQKKVKQSEISAMEDQLTKLLVDSTPKHPLVIELKKKIDSAKEDMDRGQYSVNPASIAGSNTELQSLKTELKQMREELSQSSLDASDSGANRAKIASATNDKLYKLLLLDKIDNVQTRDQDVNQKLYNELLTRLETAKITQRLEASKEGTRYTVLDPARMPLKPAKPNKVLVLFIAFFMGICAGVGIVLLVEMFDHSFLGVDEAKAFLELSMLGAVSKIVTEADVKAQKLRNTRITAASILGGVALVVVVIFNVFLGN